MENMAKVCVRLTEDEKDAFIAMGWTLHGGPYETPELCVANCIDTGTATSTSTSEGGESTCNWCTSRSLPLELSFEIVSGCPGATTFWTATYNSLGAQGAGWYTPTETLNAKTLQWFIPCTANPVGNIECQQIIDGGTIRTGNRVPSVCNPLNSGNIDIPTTDPCPGGTTVRVFE